MKTRTLFPLTTLLLSFSSLLAEPPVVLAPHGWSEKTKKAEFSKAGRSVLINEGMAEPTHTIGVLILPGDGLVVREVMEGSPAQKAGIKVMDEIAEVNGIKLSGIEALRGIVSAAGVQSLEILVRRGQGGLVLAITPEPVKEKPADGERADDSSSEVKPTGTQKDAGTDIAREGERAEQLLGQILAEMKKMNDREDRVRRIQGAPSRVQSTQPTDRVETRAPRPRVVLPRAPQLRPEAGPREGTRPAEIPPTRQPDTLPAPRQKGTD